jgi:DNA mismatch repair protein MutS
MQLSVEKTGTISHLRPFRLVVEDDRMKVTNATLLGLEILPADRLNYKDSLLGFLDKTQTPMGVRELRKVSPLNKRLRAT